MPFDPQPPGLRLVTSSADALGRPVVLAGSPVRTATCVPTTFTVASAMCWLGHECADPRCCDPVAEMPASIWFMCAHSGLLQWPPITRVLLTSAPPKDGVGHLSRLLTDVNLCARDDRIEVVYPSPGDVGR